jgi:hypothetical protein
MIKQLSQVDYWPIGPVCQARMASMALVWLDLEVVSGIAAFETDLPKLQRLQNSGSEDYEQGWNEHQE